MTEQEEKDLEEYIANCHPLIGTKTQEGHEIIGEITDILGFVGALKRGQRIYYATPKLVCDAGFASTWSIGRVLTSIQNRQLFTVLENRESK
jgi:hypothetical protein